MSRRLTGRDLEAAPHLRPICFEIGAVGNTKPMRLSPQHRVLISGGQAELHFGEPQVLAPAKAFVDGQSVVVDRTVDGVTYFHLLLDDHQLLRSDGAITESLYPGWAGFKPGQRELRQIFGNQLSAIGAKSLVRPTISAREAEAIVGRIMA